MEAYINVPTIKFDVVLWAVLIIIRYELVQPDRLLKCIIPLYQRRCLPLNSQMLPTNAQGAGTHFQTTSFHWQCRFPAQHSRRPRRQDSTHKASNHSKQTIGLASLVVNILNLTLIRELAIHWAANSATVMQSHSIKSQAMSRKYKQNISNGWA